MSGGWKKSYLKNEIDNFKKVNDEKIKIDKVGEHAIAAYSCRPSSPVALAFEPVVEINLLHQDTGPL